MISKLWLKKFSALLKIFLNLQNLRRLTSFDFLNFDNLAGSVFRSPAPPSDATKVNLQI